MDDIQIKVDQIFAKFDHTVTPGCALAVIKDGETIYKRGYGMANLEYGVPISPATIFHIASISKHFAALAVTLLAHEGRLSLDDEVRKYVPELPDFGEKITIRHLIYHTSGLRDQWELLITAGWRMDDVITMDDILELVSNQKELNFKPGDEHIYCNTGYTLLSFIVQRVTEKSMREFCEERLFSPLGMKSTHFHDDHRMLVPNRSYSYAPLEYNRYQNAQLSYANVGATSLFTTVEDMAAWDSEFYEGKVFGKALIDEMHTLGELNSGEKLEYAYGLHIAAYRGLRIVEHGGADAGYRTHMLRFPDQRFSVIVFSNLSNSAPSTLAYQVADLYLADQFTEPLVQEQVVELSQEEWGQYAGLYYSAKNQSVYQLEMREGKLVVAMGPGLELEALSDQRLRVKEYPMMKIDLSSFDEDGVRLLQARAGYGKPDVYRQVEPASPGKEELETLAGTYFCPELDVKYTLHLQDDALHLKRRKYGSLPLGPAIKDDFTYMDMAYLHFTRNEKGEVDGFKMSSGRVKNLRFVKA